MDTLTRMRALVAVVDAGGYSAAARKIGRSKALLSKHVRELEDEVGALLLNRTSRRVSLTTAGELYVRRASELIREIDGLSDIVRDQAEASGGLVRLTAPRALGDSTHGNALVDFAAAHPDISLEIELSDRFVDLVEEGYDLAIRVTHLDDSGLIARKLGSARLMVVASPELLERTGVPKRPDDMADRPVIVDTNRQNPWQLGLRDPHGVRINVAIERAQVTVNSPIVALRAACAGLGFAMVPDFLAHEAIAEGRVREVLPDHAPEPFGIYAL